MCHECDAPNHCAEPRRCTCASGYLEETVEDGSVVCRPHCDPPCIDGHCVEPSKCQCAEGFSLFNLTVCQKDCEKECIFGECQHGNCVCESGYTMVEGSTHECQPFCNVPCINGVCYTPGLCGCDEGFTLHNGTECRPDCTPECENGYCLAPNICDCHEGYHKRTFHEDHVCIPTCFEGEIDSFEDISGCQNGICVAPHLCECFEGFILSAIDNYTCEIVDNSTELPHLVLKDTQRSSLRTLFLTIFAILLAAGVFVAFAYKKWYDKQVDYNIEEKGKFYPIFGKPSLIFKNFIPEFDLGVIHSVHEGNEAYA